jgi:hypothetical protein
MKQKLLDNSDNNSSYFHLQSQERQHTSYAWLHGVVEDFMEKGDDQRL